MKSPPLNYRPEIDGLRAIAVMAVVLFHARLPVPGGFLGVDIFFVISGYLIFRIISGAMARQEFRMGDFFIRRLRRLMPALCVLILVTVPFAYWLLPPDFMKNYSQSLPTAIFYLSNLLFWWESGYFDTMAQLKVLLHTWSLSVEGQFYLAFPLILLLFRKRTTMALVVMGACSLVLHGVFYHHHSEAAFFLPVFRAWEFIAGALVARFAKPLAGLALRVRLVPEVALILIFYSLLFYDDQFFHYPLVVFSSAVLIITSQASSGAGELLRLRALVFTGAISYSLYLYHHPLFVFAKIIALPTSSPSFALAMITMSYALAICSYYLVERPFRAKGPKRISDRRFFVGVAACVLLISGVGTLGHLEEGLPNRFALTEIQRSYLNTNKPSPERDRCHGGEGEYFIAPEDSCQYGKGTARWAVLGDSHGVELAYSLAEELKHENVGIRHLTYSGCRPYEMVDPKLNEKKNCRSWTGESLRYLTENESIANVVISYRINYHLSGEHSFDFPRTPQLHDDALEVVESYIGLANRLAGEGKRVFLILQAPELPEPIDFLIYKNRHENGIVATERDWWDRRNALVTEYKNQIRPDVTVIDPASLFCDDDWCYAGREGLSYYFDTNHMSLAGAALVADRIVAASRK